MRLVQNGASGIRYALVVLIWSWSLLAIPVIFGLDFSNTLTEGAYILAGASPTVIGLIFVCLTCDRGYIRSFLKRSISLKKLRGINLLIIFMLVPVVTVLSAWISLVLTHTDTDWSKLLSYCKDPVSMIMFAVFTFAFGPLAEEIGWRGYLLDCWRDKGILVYGAGIGFIWTLWHLPMFFISGTYQNTLLLQGILPLVCFAVSTTSLGIIIGSIVQKTGSILAAVIFHFTINFTGEIISIPLFAEIIKTVIFTAAAALVIYRSLIKRRFAA